MDHNEGTIALTQLVLIDRIIDAMGLTNATKVEAPAEYGAPPKGHDGESCNSQFNYSSIVGMLLYLQNHSRPELTFAVSQCARYTYCLKLSHEKALKRIGRMSRRNPHKNTCCRTFFSFRNFRSIL